MSDLEFRIYPAATPTTGLLATLTGDDYLESTGLRQELNGTGSGRISIHSAHAAVTGDNFAQGNYVQVWDMDLGSGEAIGGFWLTEGDFEAVSSKEESGRVLTFGGPGSLAYMGRAEWWRGAFTGVSTTTVQKTRRFPCVADAVVAWRSDASFNLGAGKCRHLPIGRNSGSFYYIRSLVHFGLDFTSMATIESATLYMYGSNYHGTPTSPDFYIKRNTSAWSEGTHGADDPNWYGANAVNFGNKPSTTSTDHVHSTNWADNSWRSFDVTALIKAWGNVGTFPGAGGNPNYGLTLKQLSNDSGSADEPGTMFCEFESREGPNPPYIDVVYSEQQTVSTGPREDGSWHWTADQYGDILKRAIDEAQATDRPSHPIPDLTYDFDSDVDSAGLGWSSFVGEHTIPVGTNYLQTVSDFMRLGLTIVMDPDLALHAYQTEYGREKASDAFGAGFVRFEAGVNIAADVVRKIRESAQVSHLLVAGTSPDPSTFVVSTDPAAAYDKEGYLRVDDAADAATLQAAGQKDILLRNTKSDTARIKHIPGDDEAAGLYTPGWPGGAGHYWLGDTITVHTGDTVLDFDEQRFRVAGISWVLRPGGDWDISLDVGASYVAISLPSIPGVTAPGVSGCTCPHPPLQPGAPGSAVVDWLWSYGTDTLDDLTGTVDSGGNYDTWGNPGGSVYIAGLPSSGYLGCDDAAATPGTYHFDIDVWNNSDVQNPSGVKVVVTAKNGSHADIYTHTSPFLASPKHFWDHYAADVVFPAGTAYWSWTTSPYRFHAVDNISLSHGGTGDSAPGDDPPPAASDGVGDIGDDVGCYALCDHRHPAQLADATQITDEAGYYPGSTNVEDALQWGAGKVIGVLTNKSGGTVIAGDVVIVDTTTDNSFTTTTTAAKETGIGIALETIPSNEDGPVLLSGIAPLVKTAGAVTRAHYLFTSTVAKEATGSATRGAGAFGQFLDSSSTPRAVIWGVADQTAAAGGGGGGSGTVARGVTVTRAATQSISNATPTAVSFDTEVRDDAGLWTSGSPTRITIPETGWYMGEGFAVHAADSDGGRRVYWQVNGSTTVGRASVVSPAAMNDPTVQATFIEYLAAGDYVELMIDQNAGNSLNITGRASVVILVGSSVINLMGDWTDYTPVWGSDGTAPSLGNGTIQGRYKKLDASTVIVNIVMARGSTSTNGTGNYNWTLPFTAGDRDQAIAAWLVDSGTRYYAGTGRIVASGNLVQMISADASGIFIVAATVPMTWATGDTINFTGVYQIVPSGAASGPLVMTNEVYNFPSLEGADNTQPEWWEESAGTATLTEVDVAGESITETWERCLKLVTSADVYAYTRYTYADEKRLKSGRTVSAMVAVWAVGGATARVRLQSSVGSLGVVTTTATGWNLLEVNGVVLDGTYVDLRLEVNNGTAYFVPLGFGVGSKIMGELPARGLTYRIKDDPAALRTMDGLNDEATWTDVDCTSAASPLAVMAQVGVSSFEATSDFRLYARRNGSSAAASDNTFRTFVGPGVTFGVNEWDILLDDQQIYEYYLDRTSGSSAIDFATQWLHGWWEWA